jgi:hypothetical protein
VQEIHPFPHRARARGSKGPAGSLAWHCLSPRK